MKKLVALMLVACGPINLDLNQPAPDPSSSASPPAEAPTASARAEQPTAPVMVVDAGAPDAMVVADAASDADASDAHVWTEAEISALFLSAPSVPPVFDPTAPSWLFDGSTGTGRLLRMTPPTPSKMVWHGHKGPMCGDGIFMDYWDNTIGSGGTWAQERPGTEWAFKILMARHCK